MKQQFSMEEIKGALLGDITSPAAVTELLEAFRAQWDREKAADLTETIARKTEEQAAADPAMKADFDSWTPFDRLLWIVKEAFCLGQLQGHQTAQEITRMQLDQMAAQ